MKTVKHCLHCGQWFTPNGDADLLCKNCGGFDASPKIMRWWGGFALAVIAIVIWLFIKGVFDL